MAKRNQNLNRSIKGYALTEVLLALALFGLILLPLLAINLAQTRDSLRAYWRTVAINQAQSMLERLRANQTPSARHRELVLWNKQNFMVLPKGHGSYACRQYDHFCRVTLSWWSGDKQSYALGALVL